MKNIHILPKEEPKQKTLKEAALRYASKKLQRIFIPYKELNVNVAEYVGFINGAKWQQKQSKNLYSEEDMINFTEWVIINYQNQYKLLTTPDKKGFYTTKELLIKWLEKFKKK